MHVLACMCLMAGWDYPCVIACGAALGWDSPAPCEAVTCQTGGCKSTCFVLFPIRTCLLPPYTRHLINNKCAMCFTIPLHGFFHEWCRSLLNLLCVVSKTFGLLEKFDVHSRNCCISAVWCRKVRPLPSIPESQGRHTVSSSTSHATFRWFGLCSMGVTWLCSSLMLYD